MSEILGASPKLQVPSEWSPPLITYFVATTPRSGSTYFCSVLHKTNFLGYPDEYFNHVITINAGRLQPTLLNQLMHARRDGTTSNGVCGIKIMPEQFENVIGQTHFEDWFPARKWLFLRRRDKLAQAISFDRAEQTGSWSSLEAPKSAAIYSRQRIEQKLDELNGQEAYWINFFMNRQIDHIEIWYEDFLKDVRSIAQHVATYLGVPSVECLEPVRPTYFDKMAIQRDETNLRWADLYRRGK